jgi:hypothetical protein
VAGAWEAPEEAISRLKYSSSAVLDAGRSVLEARGVAAACAGRKKGEVLGWFLSGFGVVLEWYLEDWGWFWSGLFAVFAWVFGLNFGAGRTWRTAGSDVRETLFFESWEGKVRAYRYMEICKEQVEKGGF